MFDQILAVTFIVRDSVGVLMDWAALPSADGLIVATSNEGN